MLYMNSSQSFSSVPSQMRCYIAKVLKCVQMGIQKNADKTVLFADFWAHLQSSVFKLSKDLIDSIHEEGIVAYTS